jgi:K+-sensing histidine kinase KdpD
MAPYAVAVVAVAAALAGALWLQDHLVGAPVPLFLCAVMLSAWFGGLRAGLLAAALSLLAFDYYFVLPLYSLAVDRDEIPRLLLVAASILFVGLLTAAQHNAKALLEGARDELDGSVSRPQTRQRRIARGEHRTQAGRRSVAGG